MKKIMVLLVSIAFAGVTAAQEKVTAGNLSGQDASWQGYLVDAQYAGKISADPATAMQMAASYSRAESRARTAEAGFGLMTKGQWLKFDQEGDKQALVIIEKSHREHGFFVTVLGRKEGDTILVTSIEESEGQTPQQLN